MTIEEIDAKWSEFVTEMHCEYGHEPDFDVKLSEQYQEFLQVRQEFLDGTLEERRAEELQAS